MPTYEYKCDACGEAFEKFQTMSSAPIKKCPKCGKNKVRRLIGTGAGLIFKGSGFYITDYRDSKYQESQKADNGNPPAEAKGGETKAEAKSGDPKSNDSQSSNSKSTESKSTDSKAGASASGEPKSTTSSNTASKSDAKGDPSSGSRATTSKDKLAKSDN